MSHIISICLRKGGSGKTTTAVNLATALQQKGHKTLLVDLDDQANATMCVGINPFVLTHAVDTLFTDIAVRPQDVITMTEFGLAVLPARQALEQVAAGMNARSLGTLKPIMDAISPDFEYIIIDTPPSHSYLSLSALFASNFALIPLQTHYLAMDGLTRIMEDIRGIQNGLNPKLQVLGIVPCMVQSSTNVAKMILTKVRDDYADLVLPIEVKYSIKFVEASLLGQPAVIYASESAQEYVSLAEVVYAKTK